MGSTLRVSHFGLLLFSLFLMCESSLDSSEVPKKRQGRRIACNKNWYRNVCMKKWIFYKKYCYRVFDEHVDRSKAEIICQDKKQSAHLASFHDKKELNKVARYLSSMDLDGESVWIGLGDSTQTRNWSWSDMAPTIFFPWDSGEPNNIGGDEFCVHLSAHRGYKKMNDASCLLELPFLCKYAV